VRDNIGLAKEAESSALVELRVLDDQVEDIVNIHEEEEEEEEEERQLFEEEIPDPFINKSAPPIATTSSTMATDNNAHVAKTSIAPIVSNQLSVSTTTLTEEVPQKRISKFKQERMNRK
jgi:hypothetical protein